MKIYSIQRNLRWASRWVEIPEEDHPDVYERYRQLSFLSELMYIKACLGPIIAFCDSETAQIVLFRDPWGGIGGIARM